MELLLGPGHVVAGVVGADHQVGLGVVTAALDEVGLDPVDGDLVARVVRTGQGLLPTAERHLEILIILGNELIIERKYLEVQQDYN